MVGVPGQVSFFEEGRFVMCYDNGLYCVFY